MKVTKKDNNEGVVALTIGIVIVLACLLGGPIAMGADSVWVPIKPPSDSVPFRSHKLSCEVCGRCFPIEIERAVTLMGCLKPPYCCNRAILIFECTTKPGETFEVNIGECDWIKWGRVIAKKDIDSLVDKRDWTIKDKKKKK